MLLLHDRVATCPVCSVSDLRSTAKKVNLASPWSSVDKPLLSLLCHPLKRMAAMKSSPDRITLVVTKHRVHETSLKGTDDRLKMDSVQTYTSL
jgi:hypothetical protein